MCSRFVIWICLSGDRVRGGCGREDFPRRCLRKHILHIEAHGVLLKPISLGHCGKTNYVKPCFSILTPVENHPWICLKITSQGLPWWRSGWESACQCRGHGFEPWSGRIPHAAEKLGPWATTAEPARLEPVLRNKRPRWWGACAPRWRVAPACHN